MKPAIDRDFRTLPGRETTAIAGSSMGGLISLYAAYQRADLFAAVGAMSPALWFGERAFLRYLSAARRAVRPRIYLDIGLHEPAQAVADVRSLRDSLLDAGHGDRDDLHYVEDESGGHNEETWGRRFTRALPFLLGADPDRVTGDGPGG